MHRLMPILAESFAMIFSHKRCVLGKFWEIYFFLSVKIMYEKVVKEMEEFNISSLGDFHTLSAGLKAVMTWDTMSILDTCRQCLGGKNKLVKFR